MPHITRYLQEVASTDLSLPPDTYIYSLISCAPQIAPHSFAHGGPLAAISSDNSLRFVDTATLTSRRGAIEDVHNSVTCLSRFSDDGNVVITAGRDGYVRLWDTRISARAVQIVTRNPSTPFSSVVGSDSANIIAAGTELQDDGPGDAPILIWDPRYIARTHPRTVAQPLQIFTESHTDTITQLVLDPLHPYMLISGSTDGLVNIFDVRQQQEVDALFQVINHGSAIHCTGITLGPFERPDVYMLGTDETLSFHTMASVNADSPEPRPAVLGDMRVHLDCEYAIKIFSCGFNGTDGLIAVGKHSSTAQHLDLVPLSIEIPPLPDVDHVTRLPGAHGEDIVRDIYVEGDATFTCGEDGIVRAWRPTQAVPVKKEIVVKKEVVVKEEEDVVPRSRRERRKEGLVKIKKEGDRFKPY